MNLGSILSSTTKNVRKFIRMNGVAFTLALLENNMSIRYVYIIANNWQMKP